MEKNCVRGLQTYSLKPGQDAQSVLEKGRQNSSKKGGLQDTGKMRNWWAEKERKYGRGKIPRRKKTTRETKGGSGVSKKKQHSMGMAKLHGKRGQLHGKKKKEKKG